MAEEEYGGTGGTGGAENKNDDGGNNYAQEMSESDLIKLDLLKGLLSKNINLSDFELGELTGFSTKQIGDIRSSQNKSTLDSSDVPLSWDYVLAFNVGNKDDKHKPSKKDKKARNEDDNDEEWENGMPQDKYFGQLFNNFWQRLEAAKLSVEAYRSQDKKMMFLIVGITEKNLKQWADDRDTDLLIDSVGGVEVGRTRRFPLALRTRLRTDAPDGDGDGGDDGGGAERASSANIMSNVVGSVMGAFEETLDLSNWNFLYGEYNQQANSKVYQHYKRLRNNDNLETVFDEKTRLRIIYECIIADSNEGGAEIKIEDCLLKKKHPLVAVFPLHDAQTLDNFDKTWIKNWKPTYLMWCPLSDIRDYFGEPVAFYFAFLSFYLKWLIAPAIVGLIFFVYQLAVDTIAVDAIPLLCFFMIFWSVAFVDFWARAEARYRLMWGMTKFETKAVARPQFTGEWTHDSVTGEWAEEFPLFKRAIRASAVLTGVILWLAACIVCVIQILLLRDVDPNKIEVKIYLGVANGAMIFVFDVIYKLMSRYGNDWENHRTEQDYQNALIAKSFFFKFFNSFASLFYLGFVRPEAKGLYYYVRFYNTVCGIAPQYMAQFLNVYNDNQSYYDNLDYDYSAYWDTSSESWKDGYTEGCLSAPTDCTSSDPMAECVDEYKNCISAVSTDDDWSICTEGYPALIDGSGCPSDIRDVDGNVVDIEEVNGFCTAACDPTDTAIENNNAVLDELRIQLLSLFLTAIVIQNTLEVLLPFVGQYLKDKKREKAAIKAGEEIRQISEAEEQAGKDPYANTIDDMSEMIVQFGYVTLFVMAFPLTPLLAIVNNIIEMKVDAVNLVKTSQRPHPNGSFGLGTWNSVLGFFSIIAVGTNVALITFRTNFVTTVFLENESAKWIFFSIVSIVLGLLVAAEKWIIPDVPVEVEQAVERQRLVESVLILGAAVDETGNEPPGDDDDGNIPFDPSLEFIDVETLPDVPLENLMYGGNADPSS